MLDRRKFLNAALPAIGLSIFGHKVLIRQEGQFNDFDPNQTYGNAVYCKAKWEYRFEARAKELIRRDMESVVPPKYRRRVEFLSKDFKWGTRHAWGWIYDPDLCEPIPF